MGSLQQQQQQQQQQQRTKGPHKLYLVKKKKKYSCPNKGQRPKNIFFLTKFPQKRIFSYMSWNVCKKMFYRRQFPKMKFKVQIIITLQNVLNNFFKLSSTEFCTDNMSVITNHGNLKNVKILLILICSWRHKTKVKYSYIFIFEEIAFWNIRFKIYVPIVRYFSSKLR